MTASESIPRYDLLVSLDRSDRTAALALLDLGTGALLTESVIDLAPEALDAWWRTLRAAHPQAPIAVAFGQPAPNLLAFFAPRQPAAIYALNPSATWAYRQSLTVSRARNDQSDARDQALFVKNHLAELKPWAAPAATVVQLERLTLSRRKQVDARIALTNQLQAALKRYFPQALELLHELATNEPGVLAQMAQCPKNSKKCRSRGCAPFIINMAAARKHGGRSGPR